MPAPTQLLTTDFGRAHSPSEGGIIHSTDATAVVAVQSVATASSGDSNAGAPIRSPTKSVSFHHRAHAPHIQGDAGGAAFTSSAADDLGVAVSDADDDAAAQDDGSGLTPAGRKIREVLLAALPPSDGVVDSGAGSERAQLEAALAAAGKGQLAPAELDAMLKRLWATRQAELRAAFAATTTEAKQMQTLLSSLLLEHSGRPHGISAEVESSGTTAAVSDDNRPALLADLEYFVSQVHNAEDFATMGGLTAVTLLLNESNPAVAAGAAWVLGTAVKYAQPLQLLALAEGALPRLLSVCGSATAHDFSGETAASTAALLAKVVYALGGLIRSCGEAQEQFVALRGPAQLANVLRWSTAGALAARAEIAAAATSEAAGAVRQLQLAYASVVAKTASLIADVHLDSVGEPLDVDTSQDAASPSGGLPKPSRCTADLRSLLPSAPRDICRSLQDAADTLSDISLEHSVIAARLVGHRDVVVNARDVCALFCERA